MMMNAEQVAEYSTRDLPPMEAKESMSDRKRSHKRRNNIGT